MSKNDWESYVAEVREKSSGLLRELAEARTRLIPAGRGKYKCTSPIRSNDTDPSFYVSEEQGFWHDFGTSESGDVISFVRRTENLSFREAIDSLARRCGVATWDERRKNGSSHLSQDEILSMWRETEDAHEVKRLITSITLLCHRHLPERVRTYLRDHYGLSDETIDEEKIGWCLEGLFSFCKEVWPDADDGVLMATGFFLKTSEGVKTHLGGRILFPYWKDGQVVYTIGREHHWGLPKESVTISEYDLGKYKKHLTSSPSHPYVSPYVTNDHFWGEDTLKKARGGTAYLTEGVTDAIMLKQLGYAVISPVTKEFKESSIPRAISLLRVAKETVILNDNEEKFDKRTGEVRNPGMDGAVRMASALIAARCSVRVGVLPRPDGRDKVDVNEICTLKIREGGLDAARAEVDRIAKSAVSLVDLLLDVRLKPDASDADKSRVVSNIAEISSHLPEVEVDFVVSKVSQKLKLKKSSVQKELAEARKDKQKKEREDRAKEEKEDGPSKKVVRGVFDQLTYYDKFVPGEKEAVEISTFSLTLKSVLVPEDKSEIASLCVDVIGRDGDVIREDWVVPPRAWTGAKEFVKTFPSIHMQWFGSDLDVMAVYQMLAQQTKKVTEIVSVNTIGIHERGDRRRFVVPAGTMNENGWMARPDIVFSDEAKRSAVGSMMPVVQTDPSSHVDLLRRILSLSYTLQCPNLSFPMISWFGASLFKPDLDKHGYPNFPLLMIYGTQGSGKTSATRLFWSTFTGVKKSSLASNQKPHATLLDMCATTNLAVFFDEYRPEQMTTTDVNNLKMRIRFSYDRATESKGQRDGGSEQFKFSSPVIIAGEHAMDDDSAIMERLIFAAGDKNWLNLQADKKTFVDLDGEPVDRCALYVQRWCLSTDVTPFVSDARGVASAFFSRTSTVSERIRKNVEQALVGHAALRALANSLGTSLPDVDVFARLEDMVSRSVGVGRHDVDDDEVHEVVQADYLAPRTALDVFLADFVIMAIQEVVREDIHYAVLNGDLFIHTDSVYAARAAWKKASGGSSDSVGTGGLKQIARENRDRGGYVKKASHRGRLWSWRDLVNEPKTAQQAKISSEVIRDQEGPREVQVNGMLIDLSKLPKWIGTPPAKFSRTQGKERAKQENDSAVTTDLFRRIVPSDGAN